MSPVRLVGSDHSLAQPSRLEQLGAAAEAIQARLIELRGRGAIAGALLLSTCNRFEVVLEPCAGAAQPSATELLGTDLPLRDLSDGAAVEHLLGVATGLHSMAFGEEQIQGQLRTAFRTAEELGMLSRKLHMLRNRLLPLAREIRQRTGLDQRPPSIASMAVDQLLAVGTRIAIVGAGATGRLLLEILQRRQVVPVLIANRSVDKAAALAQHYGGRALSLHEFVRGTDPALRELDGVAVAVRSDEPVLDRRSVGSARIVTDLSQPSVLAADLREPGGPRVVVLDDLGRTAAACADSYRERRHVVQTEVVAAARHLCNELAADRPNLGRVVDLHVEGALAELERAFGDELRHLDERDRQRLRSVLERAARRNAHHHIRDLRHLARTP
jgi:glutamyl-tRNA reductase